MFRRVVYGLLGLRLSQSQKASAGARATPPVVHSPRSRPVLQQMRLDRRPRLVRQPEQRHPYTLVTHSRSGSGKLLRLKSLIKSCGLASSNEPATDQRQTRLLDALSWWTNTACAAPTIVYPTQSCSPFHASFNRRPATALSEEEPSSSGCRSTA